MEEKKLWTQKAAAMRRMLSEVPEISVYSPVTDALRRAAQLDEQEIVGALKGLSSMPQSTRAFANPVLHRAAVHCDGADITLNIRSFAIHGVVQESEIVAGEVSPAYVIFVGLFGRKPEKAQGNLGEEAKLDALINRKFYRSRWEIREGASRRKSLIDQVVEFVRMFSDSGPEMAIHYFSTLRKANRGKNRLPDRGVNDERRDGCLLLEMIGTHMENIAVGAMAVYIRRLLREDASLTVEQLTQRIKDFIDEEEQSGKTAFQACYSLLLGHHANAVENEILERMGMIQIHHGSAGSNMVARYMATVHTTSVSDFLSVSQMTLDGARHFGAIHDMTRFINELEQLPPENRDESIRNGVLSGGLPTFGHPEIAAAGRSDEIQQDPRSGIYLDPLFRAIDNGDITLDDSQRERLKMLQRVYQIAFAEGVIKPGREKDKPLRLTPNTDFGGWSVQEALGIDEPDRTLLTYIFRGFGWMMDVREQLLQSHMIRPVISPDPSVVPTSSSDPTIPDLVVATHNRLVEGDAFSAH